MRKLNTHELEEIAGLLAYGRSQNVDAIALSIPQSLLDHIFLVDLESEQRRQALEAVRANMVECWATERIEPDAALRYQQAEHREEYVQFTILNRISRAIGTMAIRYGAHEVAPGPGRFIEAQTVVAVLRPDGVRALLTATGHQRAETVAGEDLEARLG
jgi:hypothetical protein